MTKMLTRNFINKNVAGLLLLSSIIVSSFAVAESFTSTSYGELSKNLTDELRYIIAAENNTAAITDQHIGKSTGKTRTEMIANQLTPVQISIPKNTSLVRSNNYYADFAIYGATTVLQDDYDYDGFYQTFSISFDADIYSYTPNQLAEVYALLYISKNGGPWTHYYTTDDFLIEGDTNLDEYEVITTFLSGYPTDHYDILIDLYQIGYSDIVASYSAYDSNALHALPLESADYDEPYIEVIEISHGGSFPIVLIGIFTLIYAVRSINNLNSG